MVLGRPDGEPLRKEFKLKKTTAGGRKKHVKNPGNGRLTLELAWMRGSAEEVEAARKSTAPKTSLELREYERHDAHA